MRFGVALLGLFVLAASVSAAWVRLGCTQRYEQDHSGQDYVACAVSHLDGGGGSEVITHAGYYCLKFQKWKEGQGNFRVNATLYKGSNCANWVSGDYCYNNPSQCTKEFDWEWTGSLGNSYDRFVTLEYRHDAGSGYGPFLFAHGGSPVITLMGFKINVYADWGGKITGKAKSLSNSGFSVLPTRVRKTSRRAAG